MIINSINIPDEVLADLLKGKRPAGTIGFDPTICEIDFKPFKKNVKESMENQKRVTSFSKHLPLAEKLQILDSENELAKKILVERELNLIEFC